jgi:ABC-type multidrug transport system fused ATPase/permease subunit
MTISWFEYLKAGLARDLPSDQISGRAGGANARAALRVLRPFLMRHWRSGVFGALMILLASLLSFPQPLISRYLVDNVILARRLDLLPVVILLLGGVKILTVGAGALQEFYFTRFEQAVMLDIQQTLLEHTLRLPKSFFDEKEVGYLISRISSDVGSLSWFFSSTLVYVVTNILRFIGGVAFLFYLEWRLALATLIVLPALVISARYFSKHLHILSHQDMEQYANVMKHLQETLSSIPLIKAFTTEDRESKRVMDEIRASRQIEMEETVVDSLANLVMNTAPDLAKAVVYVVGGYLAIVGQWTLGSLLAFQSYLGYVYGPAMFLASTNLQLQNALAALERVSALLAIVPEENLAAGLTVEHLQGDVQFEHVSFSYGGDETVLQDVSFCVRPGEHIAVVGPSGVGKTTLFSLILYFYRPSSGEICFDGRPSNEYELNSLRRHIGYVSQSTLLLEGTVRENLIYGNPDASAAEVEQAAQVAGIHDFICGLPDGYETIVGERGVNFSEGQKQRLSIARALIKNPAILVMDEPTSSLDLLLEKSILDVLPTQVMRKTLFIATHRISTIRMADRIIVLNEKRLEDIGTHQELFSRNHYYQSLFS